MDAAGPWAGWQARDGAWEREGGGGVTISRKMLGGSRQSLALTRSIFSAGVRTRSPRGEIAIAVGISTASAKIAAAPRVSLPRGALAN